MFFKRIETPGLAHYAYIIGEGKEVAVIDPTRNVSQCLDEVNKAGLVVGAIFETHRNEDIISGGRELAEKAPDRIGEIAAGDCAGLVAAETIPQKSEGESGIAVSPANG